MLLLTWLLDSVGALRSPIYASSGGSFSVGVRVRGTQTIEKFAASLPNAPAQRRCVLWAVPGRTAGYGRSLSNG